MSFIWGMIAALAVVFVAAQAYRSGAVSRRRAIDGLILRLDIPVNERVIGLIDRRFRDETTGIFIGGLGGLVLFSAVILANGGEALAGSGGYVPPLLILSAMAIGGAVAAVRQFAAPAGNGVRVARPVTPSLSDYVHPAWVCCGVGLTAFALGGSVAAALGVGSGDGPDWAPSLPISAVLGGAVVSVSALLVVAVLSRRLLAVPQPAGNELELRWDDALRGTALHALWFCPLALGVAASVIALDWLLSYSPVTQSILTIIGILPITLFGFRLSRRSERRLWPHALGNTELPERVPHAS